jgi:hypothetical protein
MQQNHSLLTVFATWILLIFSKLIEFMPHLQVVAVLLAIMCSFVTLVLNVPKIVKMIEKLWK